MQDMATFIIIIIKSVTVYESNIVVFRIFKVNKNSTEFRLIFEIKIFFLKLKYFLFIVLSCLLIDKAANTIE
jgi:hypothetical protein